MTPNRKLFFLAVNTGLVRNGLPDARCRDFYAERSRHGLYCAIVGNVLIPAGVGSNSVCAQISSSAAWQLLAAAISAEGAVPGVQLATAWPGYSGMKQFVASAQSDPLLACRKVSAAMSAQDVRSAFVALGRGSRHALDAGFRHLQLHAAHGYLFNLLLDHRLSAHSGLALELARDWAADVGARGGETSLRFSIRSGHSTIDQSGQEKFVEDILSITVDYLDVSAGFYNVDKRLIYPSLPKFLFIRRDAAYDLARAHPRRQFISSGKSSGAWDDSLPANLHVGIARDLIANPNFLRDRANGCTHCMKCHYFSRGGSHIICGSWRKQGPAGSQ